jgi:hypothetical protein
MKSPVAVLERCPVCALPGYAGETDDLGRHPECVPSDECVEGRGVLARAHRRAALQTDRTVLPQLRRLRRLRRRRLRQARSVVSLLG